MIIDIKLKDKLLEQDWNLPKNPNYYWFVYLFQVPVHCITVIF
jgi:hypothetical protein